MFKTHNPKVAMELAREHGHHYGLSTFPDATGQTAWLVGTAEELRRCGVVDPIDPDGVIRHGKPYRAPSMLAEQALAAWQARERDR